MVTKKQKLLLFGGGFKLPYTFNPATYSDGPLPSPWVGSTFGISGGVVINTPTYVAPGELLTDPGLEAAPYVGGLCPSLGKTGSPTVADSAPDVHGGSHAQQFTAVAVNNNLAINAGAGIAGAWYKYSAWAKRVAGSNKNAKVGIYQSNSLPSTTSSIGVSSANYAQKFVSWISTSTDVVFVYAAQESGSSAFCTIDSDDLSLKRLTYSTLLALLPAVNRLATVKVQPIPCADGTVSAIIMWASGLNPTTYLFASWRWRSPEDFIVVGLYKCVGGVYSQLIGETAAAEVANAWLEIRPVSGTVVGLYYNNVQIGADQTVSDVTGNYPGMIITGGNTVKGFFVG